jgi:hypothetical protein
MFNDIAYFRRIVGNYGKVRRILDSGRYDLGLTGVVVLKEIISANPILEPNHLVTVSKLHEEIYVLGGLIRDSYGPTIIGRKLGEIDGMIAELDDYVKRETEEKEGCDMLSAVAGAAL